MTQTSERSLSRIDKIIMRFDKTLQTLTPQTISPARENPSNRHDYKELSPEETQQAAGLMRVNHTGEVCAQALYQGQAITAKLEHVKAQMETAAEEENDHLAWCSYRLKELGASPSLLNPLFYGASFSLGAVTGLISDKISLGFVAATEELVCEHLHAHLEQLPQTDVKSRAIVEAMIDDENRHAQEAINAGAARFPMPIKGLMKLSSKIMTFTTYRL